jgi:hypothetical protein
LPTPTVTLIADPFAYCAAVGTAHDPLPPPAWTGQPLSDPSYSGPPHPFVYQGEVSLQSLTWRCWSGRVLTCDGFGAGAPCGRVTPGTVDGRDAFGFRLGPWLERTAADGPIGLPPGAGDRRPPTALTPLTDGAAFDVPDNLTDPWAYCAAVGLAGDPYPEAGSVGGGARYAGDEQLFSDPAARPLAWRCAGGEVLVCLIGGGLSSCARLVTDGRAQPWTPAFCQANPEQQRVVPTIDDSNDNIFAWGCAGGLPVIATRNHQPDEVDAEGWLVARWSPFTPANQYENFVGRCSRFAEFCTRIPPICALVPEACPLELFPEPSS